ncbi:hypothetical protein Glove_248g29 [Diversispora epigaea]|uniref:BED-type domain-containing protein n=1 Tax=Diversispora epigaea TaxID=1348612 RepID=A0A397IAC7_9GLOM|nr:hypothetical protein Glove_248g29 [Diversispora epigaea]
MVDESSINYLSSSIDSTDYIPDYFYVSSPIHEQDIAIQTTSSIIHEQEIQIESSTSSNAHVKSKVWDYFTKPYGPPKSRKTKCHKCKIEFSYHGSPSSLKYHLKNKHKIDISTNLSQVKRQSQQQQIPSQQSNFPPYSEPSFSENRNSLLQSGTTSLADKKSKVWDYFTKPYGPSKSLKTKCHKCEMEFSYNGSPSSLKYHLIHRHNIDMSTNSRHAMNQMHENQNQPLNLQLQNLKQKNADILTAEEGFFTVLNKLLKINRNDKGNKDALIIRGKFYKKVGIYEESIADLNKVLEIEPNNVKVLISKGKVYKKMGKYEESIADLSRALEIEPNNAEVLISRGYTYFRMKEYEEYMADLSRALEIEPNNAEVLISRGYTYFRMKEYEESIVDLSRALEIEPNNVGALISRGKSYYMIDKYEESIADLREL